MFVDVYFNWGRCTLTCKSSRVRNDRAKIKWMEKQVIHKNLSSNCLHHEWDCKAGWLDQITKKMNKISSFITFYHDIWTLEIFSINKSCNYMVSIEKFEEEKDGAIK